MCCCCCCCLDLCDVNVFDIEKRTPLHILCSSKSLGYPYPLPRFHFTDQTAGMTSSSSETSQSLPSMHHVMQTNARSCHELGQCTSGVTSRAFTCDRHSDDDVTGVTRRKCVVSGEKASANQLQLLKMLLKAGSHVNAQDRHRCSALHALAAAGNVDG